jgi:predicted SAM-dependent methyltransferase
MNFLAECLRILKPGGKFSAAVPNARIFLNAYHNPDSFNPAVYCRYKPAYHYNSKIDYVNYIAYMDGHLTCFVNQQRYE